MTQRKDDESLKYKRSYIEAQKSSSKRKFIEKKSEQKLTVKSEVVENSSFFYRWENSRFWLLRGIFNVLRSVWMIVMLIGGFIAWLISLLFI
ncbi:MULTISPECIES: hypothetical protein [Aequorivita]|uniref:Uncharacterized protein n=2 Tax=Aequorivita TaxID=153265 RepID=A0AB35YPC5_9FLAO|nr:hypothetical protein [Aequorivita sp. Ant34-E75]WGF91881.1 hypothetical protein QCQ61_11750 [Aequorivita sp. Ant34-E75]